MLWVRLGLAILLLVLVEARARHGGRHQPPRGESTAEVQSDNRPGRPSSSLLDYFTSEWSHPYHYSNGFGPGPRMRVWWEGPNICPRETEEVKNATESEQEIRRHFSTRFQVCDESETAYSCKLIEEDADGRREFTTIFECCHGFSRKKADFGCPEEKKLMPLMETAEELGLKDFIQATKLLQLTKRIQNNNLTIFAPVDGSFGLDSDLIGYSPTIMLGDSPSSLIVSEAGIERTVKTLQSAVLGHIVPGLRRTSSLQDEEVLETENPLGSTLRINYFEGPEKVMTVNCIRVFGRDNMATNGVIHTLENALTPVTETLMDFVRKRYELSMLKTILAKADYVSELDEDGKFTLLAPSDMAFMKMDRKLRERLMKGDRRCLERVLRNHMLPNVICSSVIQGQIHTPNLLRKYINVTRSNDNKLFVENSQVLEADVMGTNGVMHVIDEVLVPDEAHGILEVLEKKGFTELLRLLETAKLTDAVDSVNNVSVFAPTNEAIQALSQVQKSRLSSDPDLLRKVLLYHLSPGELNGLHIHDNKLIASSEGRQIRLNKRHFFYNPYKNSVTAQCVPISSHGYRACNGNIFTASKVMMPPEGNVIDVLAKDKRFSTLLSLIKKADLADVLQEEGPFTIFAPNNEAFKRVHQRTLDLLVQDPDRILNLLKSHVATGFICCARINRGWLLSFDRIYTLRGTSPVLTRNARGQPKVGHAHIVKCDRTANNGNILEVDRVLLQHAPIRRRRPHRRWRLWRT